MFNGGLQEKGEVEVKDIEPQNFRKILEFIYSENTELENVETALSVCYAANKYMINTLIMKCIDFIKENLDKDIVIRALEFARLVDNTDLEAHCLQAENYKMTEDESWRNGTLAQRILHMLDTELLTDCTFVVGITEKKTFQCHKFVLSQGSPVFYAMFNGELREKGDVEVEDIEPQHFRKMLEYIYSDNTELENVETALSVCYAANKYMINTLILKCIEFIKKNLNEEIVCRALEFAHLIDNADLEAESLQVTLHFFFKFKVFNGLYSC
ncbi:hypothetical protein B566_EDAN007026 [Ephemera danica]|nr:hypothetical protein B566_EDAN007026 [Ephemera danica]